MNYCELSDLPAESCGCRHCRPDLASLQTNNSSQGGNWGGGSESWSNEALRVLTHEVEQANKGNQTLKEAWAKAAAWRTCHDGIDTSDDAPRYEMERKQLNPNKEYTNRRDDGKSGWN